MKLSKYIRKIDYNENVVLYNSINHAIVQLPSEAFSGDTLNDDLDNEAMNALTEMGYFSISDSDIAESLRTYLVNEDKLFISVELNLSCNLRCPYCYQSGSHNGQIIGDSVIDDIIDYIKKVHDKTTYKELYIKILGGEPSLVWKKFLRLYNGVLAVCQSHNIKFHLLIDTNGTKISDFLTLCDYDSLLFTIPLSYKNCHDAVRFDAKGNGTYDLIISNINELKKAKPDAKIVIRYNVDHNNIRYFNDFLRDISEKLFFKPLISVNYTAELSTEENYNNKLSYRDFLEWCSSSAIDSLIEANLPITISPIISVEECQFRSRYSLKVFSDGTAGSCAMSFFNKNKDLLSRIVKGFSDDDMVFWKKKNEQTIMSDDECLNCDSLFLCGGTNKLPCIKALDRDLCKDKIFSVNLNKFILRYLQQEEQNNSSLFVVFEDGESYR